MDANQVGFVHELTWDDIKTMLDNALKIKPRRQMSVQFSGGEPTLQAELADAMREVRALGFRIGLHTGGAYPRRLAEVLPLVDWVGLDAKAPFADYARITWIDGSGERAQESLDCLLASGVAYEVRTTVHPALLTDEEVIELAHDLAGYGVKRYVVQAFRSQGCRDEYLCRNATRPQPLQHTCVKLAGVFESFTLRAV
jgi:pyruvate formate lyase activating enzyme